MSDPDPAAIARKLTKAQRDALLGIPKPGEPYPGWPAASRYLISRLHGAGLIYVAYLHDWQDEEPGYDSSQCYLTPLGARVRKALAVLLAEAARDA